jgi:hypothetical protein
MAERTIWGVVASNAKIVSGSGFKVDHSNTGLYTILFEEPFHVIPAISATQIFPDDVNSQGGDTRDNAVLVGVVNDRFRVKTGGSDGKGADRHFSFVAMGL